MYKIEILDSVWCRTLNKETTRFLQPFLSYEKENWIQGAFKRERTTYRANLISPQGLFLRGFKDRVDKLALTQGKKIEWVGGEERLPHSSPNLPGIIFRPDQTNLIERAVTMQRGVLECIARSGKTVIAAGIFSSFPNSNCLFLVHTKDLLNQTYEAFVTYGLKGVGRVGGGFKESYSPITVALRHSFAKLDPEDYSDFYDVVIVDEAHHVSSINGQYGKILQNLLSPIKIGLTATTDVKEGEPKLSMEGYLGPIIGELTQEQGRELGITARAKIRFVRVPDQPFVKEEVTYQGAYKKGWALNRSFNRKVITTAKEYLDQGQTVLILVRKIQHGFMLEDMFDSIFKINAVFICGGVDEETKKEISRLRARLGNSSSSKDLAARKYIEKELENVEEIYARVQARSKNRDSFRKKLDSGELRCIIATNIWNEGVNIPTLNAVLLAAGGKSEKATIQMASRSLTKSNNKEVGVIVDFFNHNHRYFIEHFGHRMCTYMEQGWFE